MRKFLLGTTAIAAAAAFASPASAGDKIQLELRGYAQFGVAGIVNEPDFFGLSRDDIGDPLSDEFFGNSVVFGSDSEVHFRGKTTLDNGLTVSFRAELELEDDAEVDDDADTIDEVYVQLDGGFGRLQFGMQDGVGDQMIISAPNVFSQFTISSIDMNPFEMYSDTAISPGARARHILGVSSFLDTSPDRSADHTKVIYFTPRVYGLQLGASYAPNPCRHDTGLDVNNAATTGCARSDKFAGNYWEVAGNFEHEFNGFGVGLSASYGQGDEDTTTPLLGDKPSEWHVGGEMFFNMVGGKLTVGGAYKETDNLDADNVGSIFAESQHYDVGAKFSHGPWELGGAYGQAESVSATTLLDEELTMIIGGASYKLGPGIKMGVGVIHGDSFWGFGGVPIDEPDATSVFSELDLRF